MKVLVCGPRDWVNEEFVHETLDHYYGLSDDLTWDVIAGDAKGVDWFALNWARTMRFSNVCFEADWKHEGNAAGPKRNLRMINEKPDVVIAFRYRAGWTAGTKTTVAMAKLRRITVIEVVEPPRYDSQNPKTW
jgi:hypothetical protein